MRHTNITRGEWVWWDGYYKGWVSVMRDIIVCLNLTSLLFTASCLNGIHNHSWSQHMHFSSSNTCTSFTVSIPTWQWWSLKRSPNIFCSLWRKVKRITELLYTSHKEDMNTSSNISHSLFFISTLLRLTCSLLAQGHCSLVSLCKDIVTTFQVPWLKLEWVIVWKIVMVGVDQMNEVTVYIHNLDVRSRSQSDDQWLLGVPIYLSGSHVSCMYTYFM